MILWSRILSNRKACKHMVAELGEVCDKGSHTVCFLSEQEASTRFKWLKDAFKGPMTEVYLFFLGALQMFL